MPRVRGTLKKKSPVKKSTGSKVIRKASKNTATKRKAKKSTLKKDSGSDQKHLAHRLAEEKGVRTLVIGHRGGFFGPENSMKGFRGAIANNLEGIEFDVWLSKDNVPMVLHGG